MTVSRGRRAKPSGAGPRPGARPRAHCTRVIAVLTPRGWRHLLLQIAVLWGFELVYALSGIYARLQADTALHNARALLALEERLGFAIELPVQHWALSGPHVLVEIANRTYFACQFGVSAGFLLWVYTRRHEQFGRVRNALLTANFISLPIMLAVPMAPPRLLPAAGFVDTLDANAVNLDSSWIDALNNPYSAMPSLHASYALVIGIAGATLTRAWWARLAWACYPLLVLYSIIATANHFLFDAVVAALTLIAVPAVNAAARRLAAERSARARRRSLTPWPPWRAAGGEACDPRRP